MWDDDDDDIDLSFGFGGRRSNRDNKDARMMSELSLQSQMADSTSEVSQLKRELAQLKLTTQAMWELVQAQTGYTDEHIKAKIKEIDLRDGQLDGKVRKNVQSCPSCNRAVSAKTGRCMYCGTQAEPASVF